jgi:hypothetical protein
MAAGMARQKVMGSGANRLSRQTGTSNPDPRETFFSLKK